MEVEQDVSSSMCNCLWVWGVSGCVFMFVRALTVCTCMCVQMQHIYVSMHVWAYGVHAVAAGCRWCTRVHKVEVPACLIKAGLQCSGREVCDATQEAVISIFPQVQVGYLTPPQRWKRQPAMCRILS